MADSVVFEVKEYMVVLRQLERMDFQGKEVLVRGLVRCHGDEYTLDIYLVDGRSTTPDPTHDLNAKRGTMFVPIGEAAMFIDILRNEKPVYAHLRNDRPEWTSLSTGREPVGEGEDAMRRAAGTDQ